jgi:hypothetical protein
MIVYQASKSEFLHHALRDDIEDIVSRQFRSVTGHRAGPSEIQAWKHSLLEMAKVLQDEEIPADVGVAIEYQLPQSSKRIDFLITGEDAAARTKVVIVELKQWSQSRRSEKDAIVWARRGGPTGETEGPHPSYQAWSYAAYLEDFNGAVQEGAMALQPCAYTCTTIRATARSTIRTTVSTSRVHRCSWRASGRSFRPSSASTCAMATAGARSIQSRTAASNRRRCWPTQWPGCYREKLSSC